MATYRAGAPDAQARVLGDIADKSRNLGFFYLINHGVPETLLANQLDWGRCFFGFPSIDAYANLSMTDQADPSGVRSMITFAAQGVGGVDTQVAAGAAERGAGLVKPPFTTDLRQYLAVLLDPEGNAIRIAAPAN
jgi:isopenicillin N synthase-like dioxygenase